MEAMGADDDFRAHVLDVSHDLRTPLNAIVGFAQLLQLEKLSLVQANWVNEIIAAGRTLDERLTALVEQAER